jgi:hypothetical protein
MKTKPHKSQVVRIIITTPRLLREEYSKIMPTYWNYLQNGYNSKCIVEAYAKNIELVKQRIREPITVRVIKDALNVKLFCNGVGQDVLVVDAFSDRGHTTPYPKRNRILKMRFLSFIMIISSPNNFFFQLYSL